MDRQPRSSAASRGLSAVHIRPSMSSYTRPQRELPRARDPQRGLPVREPLGSMWHDPQQRKRIHPEALGSPSGSVVPMGRRLLRPHPSLCIPPRGLWIRHGDGFTQGTRLEVGIQRVPNLLRWTGLTCRLPYPGGPKGARGCCFPSGVSLHPFVKGSATTMVLSRLQSSLQVTARELASPPCEDVYVRAGTEAGHPESASNMTTWVNSQFPRPDFHRQVHRHYGLHNKLRPKLPRSGRPGQSPTSAP